MGKLFGLSVLMFLLPVASVPTAEPENLVMIESPARIVIAAL